MAAASGIKRKIAAWLTTIVAFILSIPFLPTEVTPIVHVLNIAIQALGGVAVTEAAVKGSVSKFALLSTAASINTLILLLNFFPSLYFLIPPLTKLSFIINALAAGSTLKGTKNANTTIPNEV